MRKLILSFAILALAIVACQDNSDEVTPNQEVATIDMSDFSVFTNEDDIASSKSSANNALDRCHSMEVLNRQLKENPGLYKKMYNVEFHTRKLISERGKPSSGSGDEDIDVLPIEDNLGVINIPVYVHVLYNTESDKPSAATIQSQIDVLNADYRNPNTNQLPSGTTFANDATDVGVHFTLAGTDYRQSSTTDWGTGNSMKLSSQGGIDVVTPETHLNIWVVNKMTSGGRSILGFAQFPGGSAATDGVVIAKPFFGVTSGVYGGGRTATHEVGHYLNLRHIWGDGRCNADDYVLDTPVAGASNGGCPTFPSESCKTADMTMNYMDYTYDSCMYMFTDGQRNRMRAIFANGGARSSMIN